MSRHTFIPIVLVVLSSLCRGAGAQAPPDDPVLAECVLSLRGSVPSATRFDIVQILPPAPSSTLDQYKRLSQRQLRRFLTRVLPPNSEELLSLSNAVLIGNGLPQTYNGGTVFTDLETAQSYIDGLIDKYAKPAGIVPESRVQSIGASHVCYDALYGDQSVRGEAICWALQEKSKSPSLVDFETLAAPGPDCALKPSAPAP